MMAGPDLPTPILLSHRSGITNAKGLPEFRQAHAVPVKKHTVSTKSPALPSDRNQKHTYGMSSAHRNAETIRQCGPEEPAMKMLVQGAYQVSCSEPSNM
jgi:collagen type III alpha